MSRRVMVVAGEASGDRHAAGLVREALKLCPDLEFDGAGGQNLEAAGVRLYHHARDLGVVGISEVIARLPAIRRALNDLKRRLREDPPAALLLVDFPDFNLMLAKVAAEIGVPVVYFISPQLWAWRKGRIKVIKERVTRMIVFFLFERDFYEEHGVPVTFSGHPLAELSVSAQDGQLARRSLGLAPEQMVFGLLPGSRGGEVRRHLDLMLASARKILVEWPKAVFLLPIADTVETATIEGPVRSSGLPVIPLRRAFGSVVAACDAALVASGTATLELACRNVPQVVVYRLSFLTWLVAKLALRVENVSLVNLVAGRRVVPELMQGEFTPQRAAEEMLAVAEDGPRRAEMLAGLAELRSRLGEGGAYVLAAQALVDTLEEAGAGEGTT